jgi:hypothetical protein
MRPATTLQRGHAACGRSVALDAYSRHWAASVARSRLGRGSLLDPASEELDSIGAPGGDNAVIAMSSAVAPGRKG